MSDRARSRAVVAGLGLASLALYAGGVFWMAGRREPHVAYQGLFFALFALYLAAAWLVWRRPSGDRALLGLILGFGLLFRLAMLPTPVVLSSDVYRYLWDGRVQRAGVSPYRHPPAAAELAPLRDPAIHPRINRPDKRTIYPPGAQVVFAAAAAVAPDSLVGWRLGLLGAEAVTVVLLLGLLGRLGVAPSATLLYAWAPLAVLEGAHAGHLEFLVIPVTLAALAARQAGRMGWAGTWLGVAILIKLYPAILLPVWWRRGDRRLPVACGVVVAAVYLPYAWGVGPGVIGFLPEYLGSGEDFNIGLRALLTGWWPIESPLLREAVRGVTMLTLVAVLGLVLERLGRERGEDPASVFRATMAAVGAYLLLVPTAMHAWYAAWILPFLAVRPSPAWLWFSGAVSLSYLTYAWGTLPLWVRAAEFVPVYLFCLLEWRRRPATVAAGLGVGWTGLGSAASRAG